MTRREKAMDNFRKGYDCSQAVVLAYEDILPIQQPQSYFLIGSFVFLQGKDPFECFFYGFLLVRVVVHNALLQRNPY